MRASKFFHLYDCQKLLKDIASELYLKAVDQSNKSEFEIAISSLHLGLCFDASNTDIIETLGVLYGQQKKYELAHELMDRILAIDPKHIMAAYK